MKKTKLMFLAMMAFAIAFSGCSKDDDDDDFNIVGTWQQESIVMAVDLGVPDMDDMIIDEQEDEDVTITFNEDGTGSATHAEGTDTFNWTLTGDVLTISYSEMDEMDLSLNLTTKTDSRLVGEQTLTKEEMAELAEMDEEDMAYFDEFPNMEAKIKIVLVK